jgi:hypothetical protein
LVSFKAKMIEKAFTTPMEDLIEFNGKKMTLYEWSKELGILYGTLHARLYKAGWSVERAFTKPLGKQSKSAKGGL